MAIPSYSVVVFGEGGIGKSSLCLRYVNNMFNADYNPTIEDSYVKQTRIDDKICKVEILDTAGQDEFQAMRDQYYREGDGFLVCFALNDPSTVGQVEHFYEQIRRAKNDQNVPIIICGTKSDLPPSTAAQRAKTLAGRLQLPYEETSSLTGHNVNQLFELAVRLIRQRRPSDSDGPAAANRKPPPSSSSSRCCNCSCL